MENDSNELNSLKKDLSDKFFRGHLKYIQIKIVLIIIIGKANGLWRGRVTKQN